MIIIANFHLEIEPISRKQGRSPVRAASYQSREKLRDDYYGRTYYHYKDDVIHSEIIIPPYAPDRLYDRQTLWREVDRAEKRYDSRTARRVIGSLPNELTHSEQIELVREYVTGNFISMGMCVDFAIHEIINTNDPTKSNPHVHILLTDRPVNREGFSPKKNREWNDWLGNKLIKSWREQWAIAQNRTYERKGLDVRVSEKGYIDREIFDREPKIYLSRKDIYLERIGVRTARGDEQRAIEERNNDRNRDRSRERGR